MPAAVTSADVPEALPRAPSAPGAGQKSRKNSAGQLVSPKFSKSKLAKFKSIKTNFLA